MLVGAMACTGARNLGEVSEESVQQDAEALSAGAAGGEAESFAVDAPAVCKREHFYGTYDVTFKLNTGDCPAEAFPPEKFKINASGIWVNDVKANCPQVELVPENISGGCKVRFNTVCDVDHPSYGPIRLRTERNLSSTDAALKKWGGPMAVRVVQRLPDAPYVCQSTLTLSAKKR